MFQLSRHKDLILICLSEMFGLFTHNVLHLMLHVMRHMSWNVICLSAPVFGIWMFFQSFENSGSGLCGTLGNLNVCVNHFIFPFVEHTQTFLSTTGVIQSWRLCHLVSPRSWDVLFESEVLIRTRIESHPLRLAFGMRSGL